METAPAKAQVGWSRLLCSGEAWSGQGLSGKSCHKTCHIDQAGHFKDFQLFTRIELGNHWRAVSKRYDKVWPILQQDHSGSGIENEIWGEGSGGQGWKQVDRGRWCGLSGKEEDDSRCLFWTGRIEWWGHELGSGRLKAQRVWGTSLFRTQLQRTLRYYLTQISPLNKL